MICVVNMILYGLKVNIATAIVGMAKAKKNVEVSKNVSGECGFVDATVTKVDIDGPYDWTTTEQGLVVSIYFAGYLVGMFPAGYFADRWVISMRKLLSNHVLNVQMTFNHGIFFWIRIAV